jgi:hypothetical protein
LLHPTKQRSEFVALRKSGETASYYHGVLEVLYFAQMIKIMVNDELSDELNFATTIGTDVAGDVSDSSFQNMITKFRFEIFMIRCWQNSLKEAIWQGSPTQ